MSDTGLIKTIKVQLSRFWIEYSLLIALILIIGSVTIGEYYEITNIVDLSLPLDTEMFITSLNSLISLFLTGLLVVLYQRQTKISREQKQIQREQRDIINERISMLRGEIAPNIPTPMRMVGKENTFHIENEGGGAALNLRLEIKAIDNSEPGADAEISSNTCSPTPDPDSSDTSSIIRPDDSQVVSFDVKLPHPHANRSVSFNKFEPEMNKCGYEDISYKKMLVYEDSGGNRYTTAV